MVIGGKFFPVMLNDSVTEILGVNNYAKFVVICIGYINISNILIIPQNLSNFNISGQLLENFVQDYLWLLKRFQGLTVLVYEITPLHILQRIQRI